MLSVTSLITAILELLLTALPIVILHYINKERVPYNDVFSGSVWHSKQQKIYFGLLIASSGMDGIIDFIASLLTITTLQMGLIKIIQYLPKAALGMCSQLFIFWCVLDDIFQSDSRKRITAKRLAVLAVLVCGIAMTIFGFVYQALNPYEIVYQYMTIFDVILNLTGISCLAYHKQRRGMQTPLLVQLSLVGISSLTTTIMEAIWGWMLDAVTQRGREGAGVGQVITLTLCKMIEVGLQSAAYVPVELHVRILLCLTKQNIESIFMGEGMKERLFEIQ